MHAPFFALTPNCHLTCHKYVASSIDLTFASVDLAHLVDDWRTRLDMVASSEHIAITYNIRSTAGNTRTVPIHSTFRFVTSPKSNWAEFKDRLMTTFTEQGLLDLEFEDMTATDLESAVLSITAAVCRAAQDVFPARGGGFPPPRAPFWSPELDKDRKEVVSCGEGFALPERNVRLTRSRLCVDDY